VTKPTELSGSAEPGLHRRWSWSISDRDEMRWATVASVLGLCAAVALAVIGGMPFDLPMPTHSFGWVEPSCGLTRGSTAIVRGDVALAWRYNPLSFLVVGIAIAGILRALIGGISGRWLNVGYRPSKAHVFVLLALIAAFWLFQQTKADFIITSRL
jgi:hypothetical protein